MDECKPYFQKASNYGYVVIIVEPRTSWKRDADVLISLLKDYLSLNAI